MDVLEVVSKSSVWRPCGLAHLSFFPYCWMPVGRISKYTSTIDSSVARTVQSITQSTPPCKVGAIDGQAKSPYVWLLVIVARSRHWTESFHDNPGGEAVHLRLELTSHVTSEGIDYDGKGDGGSRVTRSR